MRRDAHELREVREVSRRRSKRRQTAKSLTQKINPKTQGVILTEDLIIQAQNKNEQAIEQVMGEFKPVVKSIARKYFLTDGEVEDLIQEGMIGLHKAIINFSADKGKFEPFAIMIIKQQILDAVKKSTRQKTGNNINKISIERGAFSDIDERSDLEELERKEEVSERFKNVKRQLSKKELNIFELYIAGLSIKEIADREGTTTKSVNNTLFRIKTKLKEGAN